METCLFPWWRCFCTARAAYVHLHRNDDDDDGAHGDDDSTTDAQRVVTSQLPVELWHIIFAYAAPTSHAQFVVARVCRPWRRVILDRHRVSGARRMQRGAEACRILVAREAVDSDNVNLLIWALRSACAIKPTPQACARLWERLVDTGSLACARALHDVGPWPPKCEPGCSCRHAFTNTASSGVCRISRIMVGVVTNHHVDLFRALVRWNSYGERRWHRCVMTEAIALGHSDILDVLIEERVFATIGSDTGNAPECVAQVGDGRQGTWVEWAAYSDRPESMRWLADHDMARPNDLSSALVVAARRGSTGAVEWLCQHEHLDRFAEAFVAALTCRRMKTARAMLPHVAAARVYAEIQGDTISEAVARARAHSLPLGNRAARILDALVARDANNATANAG